MAEPSEFEWHDETTRRDAAALLRNLADGVAGGEVVLGDGDGESGGSAAVPERLQAELELDVEGGAVELEAELSWPETVAEGAAAPGSEASGDDAEDTTPAEADDDPALPEILTAEGPSGSRATFEVYRDRADEWRWRLVHDNGNLIADSGEGYARRATALNGLRSVQHNAPGAEVAVDED
jgi:amphi-Trp domain-containing protein